MPSITQILSRSEQGVTEPFLCRADDDNLYYVKGLNATRRGLCAELVAGILGRDFLELPIPAFQLLTVPPELVRYSLVPGVTQLDIGVVFGSCCVEGPMELGPGNRPHVPAELAARVLVFDFWVRNDDRRMDETGGNSNLLWEPANRKLWVLDHNLAFESGIKDTELIRRHAFGGLVATKQVLTDTLKAELTRRMCAGADAWPGISARIPLEWRYQDAEHTIPAELCLDEFAVTLARIRTDPDAFWKALT